MEKTISIEGMSCNHCKAHVEKALSELAGVSKAVVNLEAKNAKVELAETVTDAAIIEAIDDAGYEVISIQ